MRKRTAGADEWMLDRYVLPAFRAKPIENVTRGDVIALLEGIAYGDGKARKPAPIQSNRIRSLVHKVFRWAVKTGRAHGNPAADTEKYGKERARDRVLTDNELWALWAAIRSPTCSCSRTSATPQGKRDLFYRGCSIGSFGPALKKRRARPRGIRRRISCGSGISTPRVARHTPG